MIERAVRYPRANRRSANEHSHQHRCRHPATSRRTCRPGRRARDAHRGVWARSRPGRQRSPGRGDGSARVVRDRVAGESTAHARGTVPRRVRRHRNRGQSWRPSDMTAVLPIESRLASAAAARQVLDATPIHCTPRQGPHAGVGAVLRRPRGGLDRKCRRAVPEPDRPRQLCGGRPGQRRDQGAHGAGLRPRRPHRRRRRDERGVVVHLRRNRTDVRLPADPPHAWRGGDRPRRTGAGGSRRALRHARGGDHLGVRDVVADLDRAMSLR